jgi:urease accessory protein
MPRATEIVPAGGWAEAAADVVRLDYDRRTRRRIALTGAGGLAFLLDLAEAPTLRAGDGIRLEDGRIVAVEAAPEPLLEITCANAAQLARVAWHLGNRHLAAEIGEAAIHIRDDHVIADMVRGLGARARVVQRAFNPEGGAYGHGAVQGHGHGHGHAHGHTHNHHHHDGDHHH